MNIAVTLVAAYMLVLQSALGALALGAGPQASQLDAFGNVICTHAGEAQLPSGATPQQPPHLPNCCAFGCIMSGTTLSAPPPMFAVSHGITFETVAFAEPSAAPIALPRERSAANPRAPPSAA
jgi:hypothetical protein